MFEPKTVVLKDGKEVLIRAMKREDLERSLTFFRALPEEDRLSLRRDLTIREVIEERIREMEQGTVKRLVAVADETIVADGALEFSHLGWERHVAELRLVVAAPYQRKGLGMLMAGALYDFGVSAGIEEIVVKMMASQTAALRIFTPGCCHPDCRCCRTGCDDLRNYADLCPVGTGRISPDLAAPPSPGKGCSQGTRSRS